MKLSYIIRLFLYSLPPCCFFACGGDHEGHHHGHHHDPMFGGNLIELGNHAHNLELVHDNATGTLDAYTLGGHADKLIKIAQESILISLDQASSPPVLIELKAVSDEISKDTVGNSSHFAATLDSLKTNALKGKIQKIEIQGVTYSEVAFDLNEKHDHKH